MLSERCAGAMMLWFLSFDVLAAEPSPCDGAVTDISQVQGAAESSPVEGQTVTVQGVVTLSYDAKDAASLPGFYLQSATPDTDAATSEGVFVYCFGDAEPRCDSVVRGSVVQVNGVVEEYSAETQIIAEQMTACGPGTLPSPALLPFPVLRATPHAGVWVADLEAWEGMLVRVPAALAVSDVAQLGREGEFTACEGEPPFAFTEQHAASISGYADYSEDVARRCLRIADSRTWQNSWPIVFLPPVFASDHRLRRGDRVDGVTGVLRFGATSNGAASLGYRVVITEPPEFTLSGSSPPVPVQSSPLASPELATPLRIAELNLYNFFQHSADSAECFPTETAASCRGADSAREFERQRSKLLTVLGLLDADAYALTELENDGTQEGSTVYRLAEWLTAAHSTRCSRYLPVTLPGRAGNDAIAVGVLFCADTLELAPGSAAATLSDEWLAAHSTLFHTPLFSGPGANRVPLAVSLRERRSREVFTLVVNHLKSKRSGGLDVEEACAMDTDPDPDCDLGDGQGAWNHQRMLAVQALDVWLKSFPTGVRDPDQLLVGDFNAYRMEDPLRVLRELGYRDSLAEMDGYSYVFDGAAGRLDHALASATMERQLSGIAEWHINADEASVLDYNLDFERPPELFDANSPLRASDHDPLLVSVQLGAGCACDAPGALVGTPGDDVLVGTSGADILCGRGGNDILFGLDGDDCILGGAGEDWIFGGSGRDWVDGGDGDDQLQAGADADRVLGGPGTDHAECEPGVDACSELDAEY